MPSMHWLPGGTATVTESLRVPGMAGGARHLTSAEVPRPASTPTPQTGPLRRAGDSNRWVPRSLTLHSKPQGLGPDPGWRKERLVRSPCTAGVGYQGNVPSRGCTALLFSSAGLWVASAGQPAAHGRAVSWRENSMRARVGCLVQAWPRAQSFGERLFLPRIFS